MKPRIDYFTVLPEAVKAQMGVEIAINKLELEHSLIELMRLRASQINGCAFCVDMHTTDARKAGETERRLHAVAVWREAPFFSERERAALAWTEALTRIADTHAPDADYEALAAQFTEKEMVGLTLVITSINSWNRIAVAFRKMPAL